MFSTEIELSRELPHVGLNHPLYAPVPLIIAAAFFFALHAALWFNPQMLKNFTAIVVAFPLAPMPRRAEVEKERLIGTKLTSCPPHGGGKCTYAPVSEGPHEPMVLDTFRNHYLPPPPSHSRDVHNGDEERVRWVCFFT